MSKPKFSSKSKSRPTRPAKGAPPRATKSKAKPAKLNKPRPRDKTKAAAMAVAVKELLEEARTGQAGRPSDYKPQYNVLAEKLCLLNVGITDKDLADFFEVNVDTIQEWKLKHPEFSDSIRQGKHISDLDVADALYRRATGATYIIEKEVKRKVVEYDPKTGKKNREEEFIEVVPLLQQAPPDAVAAKYWLGNRRRSQKPDKQWTEKVELTHNGGPDPIKTEEVVGMGFARKVAFMLERSARMASQNAITVVSAPTPEGEVTAEPVTK